MCKREIWFAHLPIRENSYVQGGDRPVLLLSSELMSSVITVLPMTLRLKRLQLPTHVVVNFCDGKSLVLVEQIMTIDKSQLISYMGALNTEDMMRVENAIKNYLCLER